MTTHYQIKRGLADAITADETILQLCQKDFGRGALVIVNRFGAMGMPGEKEAPFIFLFSDGENDSGQVEEETFEIVVRIGAASTSVRPDVSTIIDRTDTANGLIVSGIEHTIEVIRERVISIAQSALLGANFRSATRLETNFASFPLDYAEIVLAFYEPLTL